LELIAEDYECGRDCESAASTLANGFCSSAWVDPCSTSRGALSIDAARQLRELADRIEEVEDSKMELLQQVNMLTADVRAANQCCQ